MYTGVGRRLRMSVSALKEAAANTTASTVNMITPTLKYIEHDDIANFNAFDFICCYFNVEINIRYSLCVRDVSGIFDITMLLCVMGHPGKRTTAPGRMP